MTFLKADFDFKLDPTAQNIISDRNGNNSNQYLKTTIGSGEENPGTGNFRR